MDNTDNYIAETSVFSPEVMVIAEALTVITALWLIYEGLRLTFFFIKRNERLSRLLTLEFATKVGTAIVTLFMAAYLFFDVTEGVKFIVVVRPIFVAASALALHKLRIFYTKEL